MASGPQSVRLKGKTVRYVVLLLLGSAAFVGVLTLGLIELQREMLPGSASAPSASATSHPAPAADQEPSPDVEAPAQQEPEEPNTELGKLKICCAVLRQDDGRIPVEYKLAYATAHGVCSVVENDPPANVDGLRAKIRALLGSAPVPAACR